MIIAGIVTVGPRHEAPTGQMWSAADPRGFPAMQVTAGQAGDVAQHGQVIPGGAGRQ